MTSKRQQTRKWFLLSFFSLLMITIGEFFEQIAFVPNWLIGNVDDNIMHFREFKHTADPGMYYFPLSILFMVSILYLLKQELSEIQKKVVKNTLWIFGVVFVVTIYVIVEINVPAIDKGLFSGEELNRKIQLWGILNCFRFGLPAIALYQLTKEFISIKGKE